MAIPIHSPSCSTPTNFPETSPPRLGRRRNALTQEDAVDFLLPSSPLLQVDRSAMQTAMNALAWTITPLQDPSPGPFRTPASTEEQTPTTLLQKTPVGSPVKYAQSQRSSSTRTPAQTLVFDQMAEIFSDAAPALFLTELEITHIETKKKERESFQHRAFQNLVQLQDIEDKTFNQIFARFKLSRDKLQTTRRQDPCFVIKSNSLFRTEERERQLLTDKEPQELGRIYSWHQRNFLAIECRRIDRMTIESDEQTSRKNS